MATGAALGAQWPRQPLATALLHTVPARSYGEGWRQGLS